MATQGRKLYDAGWRQGALIEARPRQLFLRALDSSDVDSEELPEGMQLVLVTQDCDLVKDETKLPYLEALGCISDPARARATRPNDTRYFVLDPAAGLVADRAYGATFSREALADQKAPGTSPCGGDALRARRLAIWLGARYNRPALPDDAVEQIQRPIVNAIRQLCGPGKPHEHLNRDVHEIRVIGSLEGGPPFTIGLLFVLAESADQGAAEFGVAELIEAMGFAVEGVASEDAAVVVRTWVAAPPSKLSLAAYQGSTPIPLRYESLRGEETVGAEPLDAESA